MDETLTKRNQKRHVLTCLGAALCVGLGVILFLSAFAVVDLESIQSDMDYFCASTPEELSHWMGILWIVGIASGLIGLAALITSVRCTGRLLPEGGVAQNWFDRIFVEFEILIGILAGCLVIPAYYIFENWFFFCEPVQRVVGSVEIAEKDWFDGVVPEDYGDFLETYRSYNYNIGPNWVKLVLCVLILAAAAIVAISVILSVTRRLKAHRFWRSTILGAIICAIYGKAELSDHTNVKVLAVLIGGILLSATVVGAIPVMILTLIFVPRLLGKYSDLKRGVAELAAGNPDYKIPVDGQGELDRLSESVNQIADAQKIAVANELKNQRMRTELISNVSHDLRTPLTSMISYLDLLKTEGLESEHAPDYLEILCEKTDRLKKLTDDLFEAAKASSGDIPVDITTLDMASIANQAVAELHENLEQNGIDLILTDKTEDASVLADGRLLWRVIENLLTNVSKYAQPHTRAYVDISDRGDWIALEVKNMSRDRLNVDADELMERFQRGDSARNTEGSGLGLAIARDLTELMGGIFSLYVDGDLFKATVLLRKSPVSAHTGPAPDPEEAL